MNIWESNRQSAKCTARDEPIPKREKTQKSASKVMLSVFWDAHGIIFIDCIKKGETINSDYYVALLERLKHKIAGKRPIWRKRRKCCFIKTMHCFTNQWNRWQNCMNWASNCFCIHRVLQMWIPAIFSCFQTSKRCSLERKLRRRRGALWFRVTNMRNSSLSVAIRVTYK